MHPALFTLHSSLFSPQSGFAPIALVVLLLFGIAAGTLLVQNGVNFLPEAASQYPDISKKDTSTFECNRTVLDKVDPHQYFRAFIKDAKSGTCIRQYAKFVKCLDNSVMPCPKAECKWSDADGDVDKAPVDCPATDSLGNTAAAPAAGQYSDEPESWDTNDDGVIRIRYNQKCTTDGKRIFIVKKGKTIVQDSRKDSGGSPLCNVAGRPCDPGLKPVCDTNKLQCTIINPFEAKCVAPGTAPADVPAKECKKENVDKCNTDFPKNIGCHEIDGRPRCIFPGKDPNDKSKDISCSDGETKFCKNPPDPRDGCEVVDATLVEGGTKKSIQYTRCMAAQTGAPAVPAVPGAANPPRTGNPPATGGQQPAGGTTPTGATTGTAETGCDEFTDDSGLGIPCFKIGVFKPEDLEATEAQSKVALARYEQYKIILSEVESKINKEIADKARAKIAAAEDKAKACLNIK